LKHREVNQLAQDLMSSKFVAGTWTQAVCVFIIHTEEPQRSALSSQLGL
jgi:hypothetical protein